MSYLLKQVQYSGEWSFPVDKSFILNPEINIEAKGVYLALKSFCAPGMATAFPSINTLETCLKLSRGRLYKYLRELNALGLLMREQSSGNSGKFSHTLYTLHPTSLVQKPVGGKPVYGFPHAKRYQGGEVKPREKENTKERQAEEIYRAYPKHVGKFKAIRAILIQMRKHAPEFLLEKVREFSVARNGEESRYTPNPATWFNQGRFLDDPSDWGDGKSQPHNEGDPAGTVSGRPAFWTKSGDTWLKKT